MKIQIWISIKFLLIMTLMTGILYPVMMTGLSQVTFHTKANGSLITREGRVMGSGLIGQKFDSSAYFWSRPSAVDYNPVPSGASNFGPTSIQLQKLVNERKHKFIDANSLHDTTSIPMEMLFASGSGLDPHTSPEAVLLQVNRVVRSRNFDPAREQQVYRLIYQKTEGRQFGIFGKRRINILLLNIELDKIK
jgi:potassium-transporting ATPase KdpC subunit